MHPDGSYVNNAACSQLAGRGYTTLCADSIFLRRGQDYYGYEQHAPGIASGLNFLKNPANVDGIVIEKFIVFGHSVGAPLMAFYQNIAENGAAACQGPEKILPCDASTLNNLPLPDGVILFDAHLGAALATFTYVDPAIKKENKPGSGIHCWICSISATDIRGTTPLAVPPSKARSTPTNSSSAFWRRRQTAMPICFMKHRIYGQTLTPVRAKSTLTTCLSLFPAPMALPGCGRRIQVCSQLHKKPQIFLTLPARKIIAGPNMRCTDSFGERRRRRFVRFGSKSFGSGLAWRSCASHKRPLRSDQRRYHRYRLDSSATSTASNIKGITKPLLLVFNSGDYFLPTGRNYLRRNQKS